MGIPKVKFILLLSVVIMGLFDGETNVQIHISKSLFLEIVQDFFSRTAREARMKIYLFNFGEFCSVYGNANGGGVICVRIVESELEIIRSP